jgi:DNA-binding NarL/FixJ family response regulator
MYKSVKIPCCSVYYTLLNTDNVVTLVASSECNQFIQHLSRRELEVVEAISDGSLKQKELVEKLNISVNTVKLHLKNIYQTTGASSIADLATLF